MEASESATVQSTVGDVRLISATDVRLEAQTGSVNVDAAGVSMTATGAVNIQSGSTVELKSTAQDVAVTAAGSVELASTAGSIDITAGTEAKLDAPLVTVESTGTGSHCEDASGNLVHVGGVSVDETTCLATVGNV